MLALPWSVGTFLYNAVAVSVLTYLFQFGLLNGTRFATES